MEFPNISRPRMPRIAEVKCTKYNFSPGDRILVRCYHKLDAEQQKKLRKSICKWAGVEVEVLIYCAFDFDISVEK